MTDYAAIILAGGRSSRLGGTSKATLRSGGEPLLEVVLDAVREARTRVVVGEGPVPDDVILTQEEPRYAGPAAAVVAGLAAVLSTGSAPAWCMVLACDLPGAREGVPLLLYAVETTLGAERSGGRDGWCLTDDSGRRQWLFSIVRTEALERAAHEMGDPTGAPMGRLFSHLDLKEIAAPAWVTADVDSWDDAQRWLRS